MIIFKSSLNENLITKYRSIHDKIALILALVILPIYSCIITHTGDLLNTKVKPIKNV